MSGPHPEAQWLWRRLFTWVIAAFILLQLHMLIARMPLDDLRTIAERLIMLLASLIALYLIGPSAEHIIALVRAWKDKP